MTDHRLRLFALWGTIALTLTACSSDETHLPALLADPMADYEAPGIVLVNSWEQAERPGFLGGKSTHAEVGRIFRIPDQSQVEQILLDAVEFAEANGWQLQRESAREYFGAKDFAAGSGRMHLSTPAEDVSDQSASRVLRIKLDFGSVRFDDTTSTTPGED